MSKSQWKAIALSLLFTLSLTLLSVGLLVFPQKSAAQITSVIQLKDVSETDFYFEPLQALVENYGIGSAYADGTFRGNHPSTRGEMATLINSAMDTLSMLLSSDSVLPEDLDTMRSLTEELILEMQTLRGRQDAAESQLFELESQLFGQAR